MMRFHYCRAIGLVLLGLVLGPHGARASRVVSLNLCTDQWLVKLAPEDIAALTPLARDPSVSVVAREAVRFPIVRAEAEAVLGLHPDLVLTSIYGGADLVALLRARGVRVERIDDPADFPGIIATITKVAAILHRPDRGAVLAAQVAAVMAESRSGTKTAIMWGARGYSAGPGSLGDAVLRAAGYRNIGTGGTIDIERLLTLRPDLVVVDEPPAYPSLATDMLQSPALRGLRLQALPPAWLMCGGTEAARAVRVLR